MTARVAVAVFAGACAGLALWLRALVGPPLPPPAVPLRQATISAEAVATVVGEVRSRRPGKVSALRAAPGVAVSLEDPLLEFEDTALMESRAHLRGEIAGLRASAARPPADRRIGAADAGRNLRLAALRQVEESYDLARKDFERWRELHEGGLVARVDFEREEREFAALGRRLQEARASASENVSGAAASAAPKADPRLRRAERLSERLARLPNTFVVSSPWDGTVREIHVRAGDQAARGTLLATISRAAKPLLRAAVEGLHGIVSVRSACGVPGPLLFEISDETLVLASPLASTRPGDRCRVDVLMRE